MTVLLRRSGRSIRKSELSPQFSVAERYAFAYRPQPYLRKDVTNCGTSSLDIIGVWNGLIDFVGLVLWNLQNLLRIGPGDPQHVDSSTSLLTLGTTSQQHYSSMPERVALITAGSAGLGAQIARVLAPDFRVVCRDKSQLSGRGLANLRSSVSIT